MSNKIELKSISELNGMNFFIPDYQRGYRWTNQQVKDLLNDIQDFIKTNKDSFYCIQPLVVKRNIVKKELLKEKLKQIGENESKNLLEEIDQVISSYTKWEVIDGQQRLTTIYIIFKYLNSSDPYTIEYETRPDSMSFLKEIEESKKEENIDYHHIVEAKIQIHDWFDGKSVDDKQKFSKTILDEVKFIWYESVNEDPIKVFTRLNIGKISLTNAELIKALFLNKSNFKDVDYEKIRLQQQEIAGEWDLIENTLQNDEFWLFLNELKYDKPTRIDFIFNLMCLQNALELSDEEKKYMGVDEYKTFRYFYSWFRKETDDDNEKKAGAILECWSKIKLYFQILQEWFNDLELYHYVGFLIENEIGISDLIKEWNIPNRTKDTYISEYIKPKIKSKLSVCSDLTKQYEVNGNPKTQCRPLLLLHNIQTIINQNKSLIKNERYRLPVFYKFPFHLFKKEKWDVEHIDSHTGNPLERLEDQREWLKYSYEFIDGNAVLITGENLREEIEKFIAGSPTKKEFFDLWDWVLKYTSSNTEKLRDGIMNDDGSTINEKDKVWNFTLLDFSTNRSYGNAIFPAKRRILIGKDQGKNIRIDEQLKLSESDSAIAFIPPCTKNVFLKYYNPTTNNLREWDKKDAESYLKNIESVLTDFLV